ncbi:MAG: SRPBCC family protein [Gammaproteobacteria bacterium]|nr:SRPBCC family protein [Gammaproteobacteria bacterium]
MTRRLLLSGLLWLCAAGGSRAATFYSISVSHDGDRYHVSADVHLAAPLPQVYQVLTDYNHLTRISGAIRQSRLLKQLDAHTALVFIESRACVVFFCRSIRQTQTVMQLTSQDIIAEAIPAQSNVKMSSTSWHLDREGDGTRMYWQMTLVPAFWVPPLIGPALVESGLRAQGRYTAAGVEKLARERAHLPPLPAEKAPDPPARHAG